MRFNQNHNYTTPHYYGYIYDAVYKMWFETGLFFEFWDFLAQLKIDFALCFGPNFKLLNYFSLF